MMHDNSKGNLTAFFKENEEYYAVYENKMNYEPIDIESLKKSKIYKPILGEYEHPVSGDNIFPFNYGPSTGGMTETVNFKIYTYGERILSISVYPDYKIREIKIQEESFEMALLNMERFNGFHSFSYSSLLSKTIEQTMGINVDLDTVKTRIILLETERIISHIFKSARLCEASSQNIAGYWLLYLRENLMRIVAQSSGHRYMFGINKVGGLRRKIDVDKIVIKVKETVKEFRKVLNGLYSSRIFLDRIANTCINKENFSRGPVLRATGSTYDFRKLDSYYKNIEFNVCSDKGGDSLSRFMVFTEEVMESLKIIEQAAELKDVDIHNSNTIESNLVTGIETPSGDARMILKLEEDKIKSIKLRTPSVLNMEAFALGIGGNVLTDIPFAFESFGIWISEMGVIY
jgi:Ni,Fe-hydrogenase III large subunit